MNNVLVTGHSFVRRYQDYLNQIHGQHTNYNTCLGLPRENIYITGKGGLKADTEDLNLISTKTEQVNPDIVVIELGTNDLAVKAIDEKKMVHKTIHQLFYLCDRLFKLGIQKVIL